MSAFTDAFAIGIHGLKGVSTGTCPGCPTCMDADGCADEAAHRAMLDTEQCPSSEGHFSWSPCGICGTKLPGDRSAWHWVDPKDGVVHEDDACTDCVMFLANGTEPEDWRFS